MIRKINCTVFALCIIAALSGQHVFASQSLSPGEGPVTLQGSKVATEPELAGTVIYNKRIPFKINSTLGPGGKVLFEGVLVNEVQKRENGDLIFSYSIRETKGNRTAAISSVELSSYSTPNSLNVGWREDSAGTIHPKSAKRSAGDGAAVTFEFNTPVYGTQTLSSGRSSKMLFIRPTGVTNYGKGIARIKLASGQSARLMTVAMPIRVELPPVQPTPEPQQRTCTCDPSHFWLYGENTPGITCVCTSTLTWTCTNATQLPCGKWGIYGWITPDCKFDYYYFFCGPDGWRPDVWHTSRCTAGDLNCMAQIFSELGFHNR